MESSKLELILKSIITPKATDQSLRLGFNKMCKLDRASAEAFLERLCEMSVYRAIRLVQNCPAEIEETFSPFVSNYLSKHLNAAESIDGTAVLSIVALQNVDLFRAVLPELSDDCIRDAYLTAESDAACRLTEYMLRFASDKNYRNCRKYFVQFLSRYDCGGDNAVAELMAAIMEHDDSFLLSALFETFGAKHLESLYGEQLWKELDRFLICGKDTPLLWYQYIDRFFSQQHEDEDYLISGLWYVQLFASKLRDVLPYFKLSAIETLGLRHPFVDNIVCEDDCAASSSWEYVSKFKAFIDKLWPNLTDLSYFIDIMGEANPYSNVRSSKDRYRITKETNAAGYHQLVELFRRGCDCGTIIHLFLHTYLKDSLPIEDLLECFSRHGKLEDALKEFEKIQFEGNVVKKNEKGKYVLSPNEYLVLKYHEFKNSVNLLEATLGNDESVVDKTICYSISGYRFGTVSISLSSDAEEKDPENWTVILRDLEEILSDSKKSTEKKIRISKLMDFSVERFASEYDFNSFTELLDRKIDNFETIEVVFLAAKWNAVFRAREAGISSRFFLEFQKYRGNAVTFFQHLFEAGTGYAKVLDFYLHSIYKAIVPLDCLLSLANRSEMLPILMEQTFQCRIKSDDNRNLCRLRGVLCGPVCTIENVEGADTNRIVQARCEDYELTSGVVTSIAFKQVENRRSAAKKSGSFFGYIARNASLGIQKENLIEILSPAEKCSPRDLAFIFRRMEDAIHIRRTSGASMIHLLRAMGDKNPFNVHLDRRISQAYLKYMYSEQQRERCHNDIPSILLNTPTIQEIAEIYLNTSIKFYLSAAELRSMISLRRPDLSEQIDMLFSDCGLTESELADRLSLWSGEKNDSLPAVSPQIELQKTGDSSAELSAKWDALQPDMKLQDQCADDLRGIRNAWGDYKRAFVDFFRNEHHSASRYEMNSFLIGQMEMLTHLPFLPGSEVISFAKTAVSFYSYYYHSNLFADSVYHIFLNAYGENEANRFLKPIQRKEKYAKNRMENPDDAVLTGLPDHI